MREWLVANRPPDTVWREAYLEPEDDDRELDGAIVQLHARGGDEHFLGRNPKHFLDDSLQWLTELR